MKKVHWGKVYNPKLQFNSPTKPLRPTIIPRHQIQDYFGCYHRFLWNSRITFNEVFWCTNTVMAPGPDDYSRELLIPISAVDYLLTNKNRYPHIKISND